MSAAPSTGPLRPSVAAWAVLGAIGLSFVAVVAAAEGARSLAGRVGGDFPAFYAAGSIITDGDMDELYDIRRQATEQEALVGEDAVLYFAYPPPVALGYAALALLPYVAAYVVHTVLMALALVATYWLLRPMLPAPRAPGPVVAAIAVTFLPVFMAVTLGQNSAAVVLLAAASWRLSRDGRDGLAGLVLGLLLFKPQYAIPLICLHLLRRRWQVVGASAAVTAAWWVCGALMSGPGWTSQWIEQVGDFTTADAAVNGRNAVSWLGLAEHALGVGAPVALALGLGLAALTAAALALLWWGRTDDQLALPMAGAATGVLLISPHAMFYDAALLLLVVAGLAVAGQLPGRRLLLAGWGLGGLHVANDVVGFTPVALAVIGAMAVVVRSWWRAGPELPPEATPFQSFGPGRARFDPPHLSVVIPAYDESGRVEPTLERLIEWLGDSGVDAEVIVVDDGSLDDTTLRCLRYEDELPGLRVLRLAENRGKGHAVRLGMMESTGTWRTFLDADGSTDPFELPKLLGPGAPVTIASVAVGGAELDRPQSGIRACLGRIGNRIIQWLVLPGIEDSQRGCKVFRGDVADAVFSQCVVDGWGFDVEVLARARALGHEPLEVGVRWEHRPVGHVRPWHYLTTIGEVVRIRRLTGRQDPRPCAVSTSREV